MEPSIQSMMPEPLHTPEDQTLICLWAHCFQSFDGVGSLMQHVDKHVADVQNDIKQNNLVREFRCQWKACKRAKPFDARYKLEQHMRAHTDYRPYVCDVAGCKQAFRRCENLKTHERSHTNSKPYKCQIENCEKSFACAPDRAKHHVRSHTEGKTSVCLVVDCPKSYKDPSSLRKHVKSMHGEVAYECVRRINAIERAGGDTRFVLMKCGPEVPAKTEDEVEVVSYDQIRDRVDRVKLDEKRAEIQKAVDSRKALTATVNERKALIAKPRKEQSLRKTVLKRGRKPKMSLETEKSTPGSSREGSIDSMDTCDFSAGSQYSSDYCSNESSSSYDPSEGHLDFERDTTSYPLSDGMLLSSEEESDYFTTRIAPQLDCGTLDVKIDPDFDFDLHMGSDDFDTEPVHHHPNEFHLNPAYIADVDKENRTEYNRNDPLLCDISASDNFPCERWTGEDIHPGYLFGFL